MDKDMKQLAESIARQVVGSLEGYAGAVVKTPRILYAFTDSTSHEAYTDHFIMLKNRGIGHDLLFLDGETSAWLGKQRIESGGPGKVIAVDEFAPAPLELPRDYVAVVIPEIDLDTMGRASLGLKGTVLSEVIFAALVTGKPVFIGEDVSGLKRADRVTLRTTSMPKPFQNLFDYYKQELMMYGAKFGPRARLAGMAADACGKTAPSEDSDPDCGCKHGTGEEVFEGRLVSADWVGQKLKSKDFKRLTIRKGTIVSPLAKDLLKEKGIVVQVADER